MGLIEDLGKGPVGIDSVIFIYFIEEHPRYLPILNRLFEAIDKRRLAAVTSALTLLETLVIPYRAGNVALADRYEQLLSGSRNLTLVPIDRVVLKAAAQLRALLGFTTPDAIQLAAAVSAGSTAFLTNDRRLPQIAGLRTLQLESYVK